MIESKRDKLLKDLYEIYSCVSLEDRKKYKLSDKFRNLEKYISYDMNNITECLKLDVLSSDFYFNDKQEGEYLLICSNNYIWIDSLIIESNGNMKLKKGSLTSRCNFISLGR